MFGVKEWMSFLLILSVPVIITIVAIIIDKLEKPNEKKINILYIIKIRDLCEKIKFKNKADIVVRSCNRWIRHWLDKANIENESLREEIKKCCLESSNIEYTIKSLKNLGWIILE